jgi:hypothetical protein
MGQHEHRFATQPIAEVAKDQAADRPCQEADSERAQRCQRPSFRIDVRKE